jgi:hypothetical protein
MASLKCCLLQDYRIIIIYYLENFKLDKMAHKSAVERKIGEEPGI